MKGQRIAACALCALAALSLPACSGRAEGSVKMFPETEYGIRLEDVGLYDAGDDRYSPENVGTEEGHALEGKTIYWLGSSVTYGAASGGYAVPDYLAAATGCVCVKEAVSGTTIYDDGGSGDTGARSYTRRLAESSVFDTSAEVDAFVCQISTNDCTNARLSRRGELTDASVTDVSAFDRSTTLGGVEYIIAYVSGTWGCPVYFYSGAWFGDSGTRSNSDPRGSEYGVLVDEVIKACAKWAALGYETGVIDLYGDEDFNMQATDEYYGWCMSDAIHPRRAGYLQWWTPYFENFLTIELVLKKAAG